MDIISFVVLMIIIALVMLIALAVLFAAIVVTGYCITVILSAVAATLETTMRNVFIGFGAFVIAVAALSYLLASLMVGHFGW